MRTAFLTFMLAVASPASAEPSLSETPELHLSLAREYREQAAGYRKEAAYQREVALEFARSLPPPNAKLSLENPWRKRMDAQWQAVVRNAERLAANAETLAEYHLLRARELQRR